MTYHRKLRRTEPSELPKEKRLEGEQGTGVDPMRESSDVSSPSTLEGDISCSGDLDMIYIVVQRPQEPLAKV